MAASIGVGSGLQAAGLMRAPKCAISKTANIVRTFDLKRVMTRDLGKEDRVWASRSRSARDSSLRDPSRMVTFKRVPTPPGFYEDLDWGSMSPRPSSEGSVDVLLSVEPKRRRQRSKTAGVEKLPAVNRTRSSF
uniref:Uncharacterized protein n=1 Tax=Oxyrrhis marina TaxID=2969 RepID=A7WQM7_OXYMA|nr:unknown [Oxyrrhis marina]